ncbi:N-acetyltransferase family 8 member 3-like isoform X1 [Electrophorus electricus]|uniref:N-acetyltransferase family 8 member 3-like isoform X1 n=2 Tax=Electrophorus electricus TaxID=8005 RepID=UPI0015D0CF81|nr:N-acetyltransferase family 8 member 3-like isoform X1 [Electrophorus electricus]
MENVEHGSLKAMAEVQIRCYEAHDAEDVKDIFILGMSEQVPATCLHVLKLPHTQVLLVCMLCDLAISKSLLPILVVTLLLAASWKGISCRFSRFIQTSVNKDLNHIQQTYLEMPNACFWVAENQGQVVGLVACLPAEWDKSSLELKWMSVKRSHRRQGIAKDLCLTLADFAQEQGYLAVVLYTSVVQTGAQKL